MPLRGAIKANIGGSIRVIRDMLAHNLIQRAGRLTRPQGKLTLTMSANPTVKSELLHYLEVLKQAA